MLFLLLPILFLTSSFIEAAPKLSRDEENSQFINNIDNNSEFKNLIQMLKGDLTNITPRDDLNPESILVYEFILYNFGLGFQRNRFDELKTKIKNRISRELNVSYDEYQVYKSQYLNGERIPEFQ